MSPKKILIFSLSYFPLIGGAEVAIKEITDRISDFEFDMITMRFDKSHPKFERVGNVNVYRVGGGLGYFSKILFVPQAVLFSLRRKYDTYWVMMTYMLFPITLGRILGDRTPYALTLQDGDSFTYVFGRLRILLFKPLLYYGFRRVNKVQTISNFLAEWAMKMGYKKEVQVIPNGVDLTKFPISNFQFPKNQDKITLITTSRLVEKNAVGDIIDALKFLPESVSLKILGTGHLEKVLKLKVKSLKLENRVEFLGFVFPQEIPVYLHNSDIFVRPSLSEGMGISFIEAMAAGVPIIATQVGGIKDFLIDGETGLVCNVHDPESITKAVSRLVKDHTLRENIVKNAKKMVEERYDWNLIANEMKTRVFDKV